MNLVARFIRESRKRGLELPPECRLRITGYIDHMEGEFDPNNVLKRIRDDERIPKFSRAAVCRTLMILADLELIDCIDSSQLLYRT